MTAENQKSEVSKYTLAVFLQTIGSGITMTYMNLFMTDYLMISAAAVSTTLLIAKLLDLVMSFLTGPIVEGARFKKGKYVPWMYILCIALPVCFSLTYLDTNALHFPVVVRCAIVILAYLGYGVGMSIVMICRGGFLQLMSGADMAKRGMFSARQAQATAAATIICSFLGLRLILFLQPYVGEANSYIMAILIFAIGMFVGCIMMGKQGQKYDAPVAADAKAANRVTFKDMMASVAGNSQMLIVIIALALFYVAMNVFTAIQAYYFRYVIDDYAFMSTSMTIKSAFAFVAALIMPKLGKKIGKKNSMVWGMIFYAVFEFGIMLFGHKSKWVFTLCSCGFTAAMYMFSSFGVNYLLDCGEYGYFKTGKDFRAVAMAMYNVPMKVGFAGGAAIGGYGLAMIGYEAGMEITEKFIHDFMIVIGVIPGGITLLAALVFWIGYKITDEDAHKYAQANAEKDAAKRAAQG